MYPQSTPANPAEQEEWRPIPGLDGIYEVSSYARVRRSGAGQGAVAGHVLSQILSRRGYWCVRLCVDGRRWDARVHRLVAAAFLGPCPKDLTVHHIDGEKQNNHPANLTYVTLTENVRFAHQAGRYRYGINGGPRPGSRNGIAKLTEADIPEIRARVAAGESHRAVARAFGVGRATIGRVVNGQGWRHVP